MAGSAAGRPADRRRRSRDSAARSAAATRNHQRGPPVDREAFAGERDARRDQFLPRQFGVAAMRFLHAGHHAGHRDRAGAVNVAVVLHPRPGEDVGRGAVAGQRIILKPQAPRRAHAVVDHLVAVFARAVEHHRAAAAEAAHPGLQHAERKGGRDHRVDAVAAGRQHLGADLRRPLRLRGDDAAFGGDGGFADRLRVGELVAHRMAFDMGWKFAGGARWAVFRALSLVLPPGILAWHVLRYFSRK